MDGTLYYYFCLNLYYLTLYYIGWVIVQEVVLLFLMLILEFIRNYFGKKANLTQQVAGICLSIILCLPIILCSIYFMLYQTYVLKLEFILHSIQLLFVGFEMLFELICICGFINSDLLNSNLNDKNAFFESLQSNNQNSNLSQFLMSLLPNYNASMISNISNNSNVFQNTTLTKSLIYTKVLDSLKMQYAGIKENVIQNQNIHEMAAHLKEFINQKYCQWPNCNAQFYSLDSSLSHMYLFYNFDQQSIKNLANNQNQSVVITIAKRN
ncbi:hypothetical protein A3Q56_03539 [Intoshia linei]|uniref:Transmembrane protein n=1 Tax=Intoshia linei TaxID=1819745 RepID=A0A177B3J0_9BILA|nr:hypothetical protein A3Q56_03539 [Intoshia linei]